MSSNSTWRLSMSLGFAACLLSACSSEPPGPAVTIPVAPQPLQSSSDNVICEEPRCLGMAGVKGVVPASPPVYVLPEVQPHRVAPGGMREVRPVLPQPVPMPRLLPDQELEPGVPSTLR